MITKRTVPQKISAVKVAGTYVGTVIGAGFASGQETLRFFGLHGRCGLLGLALSTVLFAVYGWLLLNMGYQLRAGSHREVVREVAGVGWGWFIDIFITVSLVGALTVMMAGAGAALQELLGVPTIAGSAVMAAVTVVTVLLGIQGVVSVVSMISPLLVAGVLLLSLSVMRVYVLNWDWALPQLAPGGWWPISALAYVSYNLTLATSVLAPMGAHVADRSAARWGAALGGLGLGLSATAVYLALMTQVPVVAMQEVPMLFVIRKVFPRAQWLYTALLLAEIYTTAVASLYGFSARIAVPDSAAFAPISIGAAGAALLASRVGFSLLVRTIYAAMGYVGGLFLLAVTIWFLRKP